MFWAPTSSKSSPQAEEILFDESLWPLVVIRIPKVVTGENFQVYLERITALLYRRERYVSVLDTRAVTRIPTEARNQQAEWVREHEELMREVLMGSAYVINSPFIRLTLSVLLHIKPLPMPHIVVPTVIDGVAWAANRLEAVGFCEAAGMIRQHHGLGGIALSG
jgi:hypothetical protein